MTNKFNMASEQEETVQAGEDMVLFSSSKFLCDKSNVNTQFNIIKGKKENDQGNHKRARVIITGTLVLMAVLLTGMALTALDTCRRLQETL